MRVEDEGGAAAWLAGILAALCAGSWTASAAGIINLSEPFCEPLVAGDQKASLASLTP